MTTFAAYALPRTANDRLKDGFEFRLAVSFMVAVALHTLAFQLWPAMEVTSFGRADRVMDVIPIDQVELPSDPAPMARPAFPIGSAAVVAEATMPDIGWPDVVELPPPAPKVASQGAESVVPFVAFTVAPSLANPGEVERALGREYPPMLRDAGIGGTVYLLVHIDALGRVLASRVGDSSGIASLDAAALQVADVFRFRPALNRDRAVEVWIRMPVVFRVRQVVSAWTHSGRR